MKIGERGQVTIPKEIRDRFGLVPETEVEFVVRNGSITLEKAKRSLDLAKWKDRVQRSMRELGYKSADDYVDDVRGR